ncbi:hypothetical protein QO002_002937 [Pararhizobium capsulatum DSM 1112]|uniref:Uncharacterized protein n=1 Tax=Pararhizobium capsulatum DSM 1112 TaxID=1121113 RepID=A0ABU0BT06_9HYPH|nr:hypothetical protein [Pararhizobium capsulatum]MDQ0320799.1 hypothetical protein [Pararhizobium capsulatum DSM 1112]
MSFYGQSIGDEALVMMKRVLDEECARREIDPDAGQGQDLALVVMHAFRSGMTDEKELVVLVRNLADEVC